MPLHNLLNTMFASPIMAVSAVVSIACASILVVNISANFSSEGSVLSSDVSRGDVLSGDAPGNTFGNNPVTQPDNAGYDYRTEDSPEQSVNSPHTAGRYISPQRAAQSRTDPAIKSKTNQNHNTFYSDGQYYAEDFDQRNENPALNNNNSSSLFNYSNVGNSNFSATTDSASTNTNNVGNSDNNTVFSTTNDNPIVASDADDNVPTSGNDFPVSLENTVKIDLDETQTISCRPIVANGPPCMCTFTLSDAGGSVSEVVDNCS